MNVWATSVMTEKGLALQAKLVEGHALEITRAVAGTGFVTEALLPQQTEVTGPQQELTIQAVSYPDEGKCAMPVLLTNDSVETGYTACQIGIYAKDPDEGEILYFIAQSLSASVGTAIPSKTEMPGYSAEWTFYFYYGQADEVHVTVEPTGYVTHKEMEAYTAEKANTDLTNINDTVILTKIQNAGGTPGAIVVTSGNSEAYTAEVPGITELTAGISFIMIPHTSSTTNRATLDVNGLGAKGIRVPLSLNTAGTAMAALDNWLVEGYPVRVMYDGNLWKTDIPRPSASSVYGTISLKSGGTGVAEESIQPGAFYVTPKEAQEEDEIPFEGHFGTLPVTAGGTGAETAAEALANLGAMPIAGGTFTGAAKAGSGAQTASTYLLRNCKLSPVEETPDEEGAICFVYR